MRRLYPVVTDGGPIVYITRPRRPFVPEHLEIPDHALAPYWAWSDRRPDPQPGAGEPNKGDNNDE